MKCGDPVLVYNKANGVRLFRHFSLATKWFKENAQATFDCRKCLHCRPKYARENASRCVLNASLHKRNCFLTLTYDESRPGYHNSYNPRDLKNFKTALRRKFKHKKIDIFRVHEYGENRKKHWHLVVFNHDFTDKVVHTIKKGIPLYKSKTLSKLWKHGFASIGDVTEASAMYQSQYMKKDFQYGYVTSKMKSKSHHSGIARDYFFKHYKQVLQLGYVPVNGEKLPIPRYFLKLAEKHAMQGHAELYQLMQAYNKIKDEKILEMETEWKQVISQHLTTKRDPDFLKALQNTSHDLKLKQLKGAF